MNTHLVQTQLPLSVPALYACQHAWENYRFYFSVVSPSFYSGWHVEEFHRDSTTDFKILSRMDALEEVVSPVGYIILHEPPKATVTHVEAPKRSLTIPKWALPAGLALGAVGGAGVAAAAVITAVTAVAITIVPVVALGGLAALVLLDPAIVAILPDGTWIEIAWYWK